MELVIYKDSGLDLKGFCNWLLPKIREYIVDNLNNDKLIYIDRYLNDSNIIRFKYNQRRIIRARDILITASYILKIKEEKDKTIIHISNNELIPNTEAKFIDIVKLINYGNLSVSGYNLYDRCMEFFAKNIRTFYEEYIGEQ